MLGRPRGQKIGQAALTEVGQARSTARRASPSAKSIVTAEPLEKKHNFHAFVHIIVSVETKCLMPRTAQSASSTPQRYDLLFFGFCRGQMLKNIKVAVLTIQRYDLLFDVS